MSEKAGQIGETVDRTICGFQIYYNDDIIFTSSEGVSIEDFRTEFVNAQSDQVLIVVIFYMGKYRRWVNGELVIENYKKEFYGYDYYWMDENNEFQQGDTQPTGLETGAVKSGAWATPDNEKWNEVYNLEHEKRAW